MKITEVTAIVLRLPQVTAVCDGTQDTCLIRIDTDAGITGWGEVDSCPTVVRAVVEAPLSHQICNGLANVLVGLDPLDIDGCAERMNEAVNYYGRMGVGAHAMAGVNIALWDIAGKAAGKPISQLLDGAGPTRFRAYCSILFGDTPAATYGLARRFADEGFTAIKFGWGPMGEDEANDIALVREARRGAGEEVDILIDAGQVWAWETARKRAEQFAEYRPYWIEEPLHPEDVGGYAQLTAVSPIPIATGEAEARLQEFQRLVVDGGLHWIQPDPGRCGISVFVAAAKIAEQYGRQVANHSFKSGITIAASLHALSAAPNSEVFEYCMSESPLRHEITTERFDVVDGYVAVPEAPGLGVTIREDALARYRVT